MRYNVKSNDEIKFWRRYHRACLLAYEDHCLGSHICLSCPTCRKTTSFQREVMNVYELALMHLSVKNALIEKVQSGAQMVPHNSNSNPQNTRFDLNGGSGE